MCYDIFITNFFSITFPIFNTFAFCETLSLIITTNLELQNAISVDYFPCYC